uniref:Integrase catalytic domain-containing protein n=1 Tax=Moniliophthora roreri TaxID=221103 RepID=A0A0W0G3X4_MONRR
MDLITDLPECNGMDSILVVVDHSSTKGVIFIPCTKTTDTTKIVELLIQDLYKRFRLPDRIISDRDPRFAAEVFQEMGKQLSIRHSISTAFHPQTDGEMEWVNQEIEVYLRAFCSKEQTRWKEYLPLAEFAHNNWTHSVLKKSPFFIMMGYHPHPLPTVFERTTIPSVEERLQELKQVREETMIRREKQKLDVFEEGQKVWLEAKNLATGYPSKKLAPKREGPFKIFKVLGPVTYRRLRPRFLQTVEDIPAVGGEVDLEEFKDKVEDGERENRIPEKEDDLLTLKLRSPTLAPTLMTQLTDHVSALCADWSAISPDTARSTCVVDASRLSLDIRLATALTNKGLGVFCAEGLIQAQTLCRTIAIMTMDHGRISPENSETLVQEYNRDAQLLFIGADLQKARFLSVEEHQVMGWQPTSDVPATPRLRTVDEMPDTPYDYDTELYGDGES